MNCDAPNALATFLAPTRNRTQHKQVGSGKWAFIHLLVLVEMANSKQRSSSRLSKRKHNPSSDGEDEAEAVDDRRVGRKAVDHNTRKKKKMKNNKQDKKENIEENTSKAASLRPKMPKAQDGSDVEDDGSKKVVKQPSDRNKSMCPMKGGNNSNHMMKRDETPATTRRERVVLTFDELQGMKFETAVSRRLIKSNARHSHAYTVNNTDALELIQCNNSQTLLNAYLLLDVNEMRADDESLALDLDDVLADNALNGFIDAGVKLARERDALLEERNELERKWRDLNHTLKVVQNNANAKDILDAADEHVLKGATHADLVRRFPFPSPKVSLIFDCLSLLPNTLI